MALINLVYRDQLFPHRAYARAFEALLARESEKQVSVISLFDVLCFPLFDGPIGEFGRSAPDATQHAVVLAAVKDAARR
jgi:hypothetical protein